MTGKWALVASLALFPMTSLVAQGPADATVDPEPRLSLKLAANSRFGLTVIRDAAGKPINKRLTFSTDGGSNSTVLKIDDKVVEFGSKAGKWLDKHDKHEKDGKGGNGVRSVWAMHGVEVSQILEIVPNNQPVEVSPGVHKRLLDTCLITYVIENKDSQAHSVGLRIQVDTLIGGNDGVPFTVPTLTGLVNTFKDFAKAGDVPEFVQALEIPNLLKPGTVGHMTLKVGRGVEPPSRVSLTRWPGFNFIPWEVPVRHMGTDSCVAIYWDPVPLGPNETRRLGFAYGLGKVSSSEGTGKLALTVNGTFLPGEPFTVTAYVQEPAKGQTLTLELPAGLERVQGEATEPVPPPTATAKNTSVITWRVTAANEGKFTLKAQSSTGISQSQVVTIAGRRPAPEGGKLIDLITSGKLAVGEEITLTAVVKNPLPNQHLTLTLPEGLTCSAGQEGKPVPPASGPDHESKVTWQVKIAKAGKFTIAVRSSTGGNVIKRIAIEGSPSGGKLIRLAASGPRVVNQVFTLTATVKSPLPDQRLHLSLPAGLSRVEGEEDALVPPAPDGQPHGESYVIWKVKAVSAGTFHVGVRSDHDGGQLAADIVIATAKTDFTELDARRALMMSVGNIPVEMNYDVDRDGSVTSLDAAIILRRSLERTRKGK